MKLQGSTAVFLVGDIAATMQWYVTGLGFSAQATPESAPHHFCILRRDEVTIFLQQLDGYQKPDLYDQRVGVWNVYIDTQGVRKLYELLSRRGDVTIIESLCHQPYGQTEFVVRDPNGYALVFAEPD